MKLVQVFENPLIPTPDHEKVDSRAIAGKADGALHCDVKIGFYQPGGTSIFHSHPFSEHVFFILEGEMTVINDKGEEITAYSNEALVVPAAEVHMAINRGSKTTTYIAVTAPPLQ